MSFYISPLFCRIRYALGFQGHVLLANHEVESSTTGYWIHEACKRPNCTYRSKRKVATYGSTPKPA